MDVSRLTGSPCRRQRLSQGRTLRLALTSPQGSANPPLGSKTAAGLLSGRFCKRRFCQQTGRALRKPASQGSKLAVKRAYMDVSDRRLQVQLTRKFCLRQNLSPRATGFDDPEGLGKSTCRKQKLPRIFILSGRFLRLWVLSAPMTPPLFRGGVFAFFRPRAGVDLRSSIPADPGGVSRRAGACRQPGAKALSGKSKRFKPPRAKPPRPPAGGARFRPSPPVGSFIFRAAGVGARRAFPARQGRKSAQRPISSFTSRKQRTAKSRSSRLWPALTCVRMRALPLGTTG